MDEFNGVPICGYCGKVIDGEDVTLDHVVPVSKGGTDKVSNLVLSCSKCNNRKRDKIIEPEFRKLSDLPPERRPPARKLPERKPTKRKPPKPEKVPVPLGTIGDIWPTSDV